MEEITKLIQNYGITTSENFYQQTTQSNDSYYTIEPTTSITNNNITNITPNLSQNSIFQKKSLYRKELVIAKIIISELQEKIKEKNIQNGELENQLNEALETIKNLHKDYCLLTDRFSQVNQSMTVTNENENKIKKIEDEKENIKKKNENLEKEKEKLKKEFEEQSEIYKINIGKLNEKIGEMQKHLDEVEEQMEKSKDNYDKGIVENLSKEKNELIQENFDLKNEIIKLKKDFQVENKKSTLEIENLKNSLSLLESKNHTLNVEIKEKDIQLQKQEKFIEQYNILDQQFSFSIKEKDKNYNLLNEQYTNLYSEYKNLKNKNEKEKRDFIEKEKFYENEKKNMSEKIKDLKLKIAKISNSNKDKKIQNFPENYEILKKQKEYIEKLLFKTHPNGNLIKQIVELNADVVQLEFQKEKVEKKMEGNENSPEIINKIEKQINIFKTHLNKLEVELSTEIIQNFHTSMMSEYSH